MKKIEVTIIGAGFAGIAALNILKKHSNIHITLINKTNYFLFTPLLPELTTGRLEEQDITVPLKNFCNQDHITLLTQEVTNIDFQNQKVHTSKQSIFYDYLITAPGSSTNYFGVSGAQERCFPLKTIPDAKQFIERCKTHLQQGERRIAIVGGGPTGVEVAADLKHAFAKDFSPEILDAISIELFQQSDCILGTYPKKIQSRALRILQKKGITVHLNTPVKKISSKGIHTPTTIVPTSCILWSAGISPCAAELTQYPTIEPTLQTQEYKKVFFAGDSALLTYPGTQNRVPALAQIAEAQGTLAAKNILALINNTTLKPFTQKPKGTLVSLGHNIAGGEMGPFVFTGKIASLLWKLVYVVKIPTIEKKLGLLKRWFFS